MSFKETERTILQINCSRLVLFIFLFYKLSGLVDCPHLFSVFFLFLRKLPNFIFLYFFHFSIFHLLFFDWIDKFGLVLASTLVEFERRNILHPWLSLHPHRLLIFLLMFLYFLEINSSYSFKLFLKFFLFLGFFFLYLFPFPLHFFIELFLL